MQEQVTVVAVQTSLNCYRKRGRHVLIKRFGKRFLDLLLSTLAIVILSPVLLVVAILVRVNAWQSCAFPSGTSRQE